MQYINITVDNKTIGELCGNVTINGRTSTISVYPENHIQALKLVQLIKDAYYFSTGFLTFPTAYISYMSNPTNAEKHLIRVIEPKEMPEEISEEMPEEL